MNSSILNFTNIFLQKSGIIKNINVMCNYSEELIRSEYFDEVDGDEEEPLDPVYSHQVILEVPFITNGVFEHPFSEHFNDVNLNIFKSFGGCTISYKVIRHSDFRQTLTFPVSMFKRESSSDIFMSFNILINYSIFQTSEYTFSVSNAKGEMAINDVEMEMFFLSLN